MKLFAAGIVLLLTGCIAKPPADIDNACQIIHQYPSWYTQAKDVAHRWRVPVPVLFAIIHQESKFRAEATPPRRKLLSVIPWTRLSSAYGYAQALTGTWAWYKQENGGLFSSRDDFYDAIDFIGWYANVMNRQVPVRRDDAYALYLAYHEGAGGYLRKSYLQKPWLIKVARKVKAKAILYSRQLADCT